MDKLFRGAEKLINKERVSQTKRQNYKNQEKIGIKIHRKKGDKGSLKYKAKTILSIRKKHLK